MIADLPWYKYFPTLFDADTALCSNQTVGGYQRLLNYIYPKNIDTIIGDSDYFARLMRCQTSEAREIISELKEQEICDIDIDSHGVVTLTSRFIKKKSARKENNRIRKQRQRAREAGH